MKTFAVFITMALHLYIFNWVVTSVTSGFHFTTLKLRLKENSPYNANELLYESSRKGLTESSMECVIYHFALAALFLMFYYQFQKSVVSFIVVTVLVIMVTATSIYRTYLFRRHANKLSDKMNKVRLNDILIYEDRDKNIESTQTFILALCWLIAGYFIW